MCVSIRLLPFELYSVISIHCVSLYQAFNRRFRSARAFCGAFRPVDDGLTVRTTTVARLLMVHILHIYSTTKMRRHMHHAYMQPIKEHFPTNQLQRSAMITGHGTHIVHIYLGAKHAIAFFAGCMYTIHVLCCRARLRCLLFPDLLELYYLAHVIVVIID